MVCCTMQLHIETNVHRVNWKKLKRPIVKMHAIKFSNSLCVCNRHNKRVRGRNRIRMKCQMWSMNIKDCHQQD